MIKGQKMKRYEKLPKSLPVPEFLDAKILQAAADFSAQRRARRVRARLVFGGAAAAAAALVIATVTLTPEKARPEKVPTVTAPVTVKEKPQVENLEWSTLDQESFMLSAELNLSNPMDEEFWI